ncbi:MAG TPA: hypothetical protein EYO01_00440 [Phycisphaerales bacterium]|jgi:hypothetical protein|nr:hypothetical protein [Phycisphaerales bacterium]HIB01868.1 hypothetical protein [Phycisphaerales bacterium]HIB51044.1 hypothetical protein [Phycisphaerales bacterium]HIN83412.1 hypothetical protein [Phycisphaerales bacterium]HIO19551.1 hypothetical protein [Phycisphaerales bacterium]
MTVSIPILLLIASLLLLLGVLAIVAIVLVASRCKCKTSMREEDVDNAIPDIDAWSEASNRLKNEFHEQK